MAEHLPVIAHPDATAISEAMFILQCVTFAALAFHVWEWFSTVTFEVKHIWRKASTSSVKWLYLFSRYFGVVVQVANTTATIYIHTSYTVSQKICALWFALQLVSGQIMLLSLEISLVIRLYALYGHDRRMVAGLILLIIGENITMTFCGVMSFQQVEMINACLSHGKPPAILAVIAVAVGVTQLTLWTLTLLKSGQRKFPLLSLLIRDSSVVCGVMSILLGSTITNIMLSQSRPLFNPFPAFTAIVTSANCRIINNMENIPQNNPSVPSIEFTSIFEPEYDESG